MSLVKWEPFGEFDRIFEDFPVMPKGSWDLAVDVYEKDDSVIAEMNLPGIDPKEIDVSVEDNQLRISGSREESKEEKDKEYYRREIRRGSFSRAVQLPAMIERAKVAAKYKDGTLTVTMPKAADQDDGQITVEVES